MSVIFTAKGCVIYPTQAVLKKNVERLQRINQMNEDEVWINGALDPFSPNQQQVYPEWNGLILPYASTYRNLNTGKLLNDAAWARVVTLAGPSDKTIVRNADHDIIQQIHMEDWFMENTPHEETYPFWIMDYKDKVFNPIKVEPPTELKQRMRIKNASGNANLLLHELTKTPLERLHPDQVPLTRFDSIQVNTRRPTQLWKP